MKQFIYWDQFIFWHMYSSSFISIEGCSWFFVKTPFNGNIWELKRVALWNCEPKYIKLNANVKGYKEIDSIEFEKITGTKFEDYFVEFL